MRAPEAASQVADVLRPEGQAHDHHGKAQTQEELAQRLNDLGDRGGHHVHVPLGIARKAEQQQVHSTAGASAHTQNTAFSLPMI